MKAYLINMAKDTERLAHMAGQFDALGIAWERIEAADMRARAPAELDAFREERRHLMRPHDWTPGQIGNLSSHMEVWRRIGEGSDAWGTVFEDDIHIDARAASLLATDAWIPAGFDIVRFETTRQGMRLGPVVPSSLPTPFEVRRLRAEAWGTAAFAIHRDVARWLACTPPRLQAPTDWMLFHAPTTIAARLATLQLTPAPCVQDQYLPATDVRSGFKSATDRDNLPQPGLMDRIRPTAARFGRGLLGKQMVEFSGSGGAPVQG